MNFKKMTSALLVAGMCTAAFAADGEFNLKGNVQTQATKTLADDDNNLSSFWIRANIGGLYKSDNFDAQVMLRIFAPQFGNKIKDGDGKTVREAAKSTKFTKTVNINKFPAVVGTKCEFKLKDGVQLTKEKYDLIATYDHQISINGKDPYGAQNLTFMQKEGVRPNVVAEQLSKWSGAQAYGFTIDAKGASSTTQDVTF